MKELIKEIVKDYGTVAVKGAKAIAVRSIIAVGSIEVITYILAAAYTVGCRVLRMRLKISPRSIPRILKQIVPHLLRISLPMRSFRLESSSLCDRMQSRIALIFATFSAPIIGGEQRVL